jgi:NAD-dependent dihydropyrimidine dehydrogenase PreA subunit
VQDYVDEIQRIAAEAEVSSVTEWLGGNPEPTQLQRFLQPDNNTALPHPPPHNAGAVPAPGGNGSDTGAEGSRRRWYPVIDFSRCTNCMECVDFCLFGVYGLDDRDTILVEQPDNCRKGCPACSRVCPENAIVFPQHKTPAIAGAPVDTSALKINLSKLFGGPDPESGAVNTAVRERAEHLENAGRDAVGPSVGIPKRHTEKDAAAKDDLDNLIDELDALDL